jgi:hypothetical protein
MPVMCWFCDLLQAEDDGDIPAASRAWGRCVLDYSKRQHVTMDEANNLLLDRMRGHEMPEMVQ